MTRKYEYKILKKIEPKSIVAQKTRYINETPPKWFYGPIHIYEGGNRCLCGLELSAQYWTDYEEILGEPTCKKCIKVAKSEEEKGNK